MSTNAIEQKRHSKSILVGQLSNALMKPVSEESKRAIILLEDEIKNLDDDISSLLKIEKIRSNDPASFTTPVLSQADVRTAVTSTITSLSTANAPNTAKRAAFNATMRDYLRGRHTQEVRDLVSNSDVSGAALIPEAYSSEITQALKSAAPLLDLSTIKSSKNGQPVKFPYVVDTAQGLNAYIESSSGNPAAYSSAYPVFASEVTSLDSFSILIRASNQLLADSDTDVVELIRNLSSRRLARGLERAATLNLDAAGNTLENQGGGILSWVSSAVTATTIASTQSSIILPYLAELQGAVDAAYGDENVFQMSQATRTLLAQIQTSTGARLLPELTDVLNPSLLGSRVVINNSLPLLSTASAKGAILYGSLKASTGIAFDSNSPRVLAMPETFAEFHETGILVTVRFGSTPLIQSGLAAFTQAAS